jgi:hypothetical protein
MINPKGSDERKSVEERQRLWIEGVECNIT